MASIFRRKPHSDSGLGDADGSEQVLVEPSDAIPIQERSVADAQAPLAPSLANRREASIQPLDTPPADDMTRDLMLRIGRAIDEWALVNGLSNMPKDIIFEQALMAMNEMYRYAHDVRPRG